MVPPETFQVMPASAAPSTLLLKVIPAVLTVQVDELPVIGAIATVWGVTVAEFASATAPAAFVTVNVKFFGLVRATVVTPTPLVAPPLTSVLPAPLQPMSADPPLKDGVSVIAAPYKGVVVETAK
jgi:hypothetical protein